MLGRLFRIRGTAGKICLTGRGSTAIGVGDLDFISRHKSRLLPSIVPRIGNLFGRVRSR